MLLVVGGRRRRFLGSTPAARRVTRDTATRQHPPTVEEIVGVIRAAGDGRHWSRLRGLIVMLWRAGLRIHEALALNESDLDHRRGSLLVRRGKGGRRREVGMDEWAWEQLQPWLDVRLELPVGPLFSASSTAPRAGDVVTRRRARRPAPRGGDRRRAATRRAPSAAPRPRVEMAHEDVPLIVIRRQLGHSDLGVTSIYLQGIDNAEIIDAVHARRAPMIPVGTSLRL